MKTRNVAVRAGDVIPHLLFYGHWGRSAVRAEWARHPDQLRRAGSGLQTGEYCTQPRDILLFIHACLFFRLQLLLVLYSVVSLSIGQREIHNAPTHLCLVH